MTGFDLVDFKKKLYREFGIPENFSIIGGQMYDYDGNAVRLWQEQADIINLWKQIEKIYDTKRGRENG